MNFLRRLFLNNLVLKAISLVLSLLAKDFKARVQVGDLEPREEPYELVPVILSPPNGEFRVESLQPEKVKVRVR